MAGDLASGLPGARETNVATGLLALLDDVIAIMDDVAAMSDDVATMSQMAAEKTAGLAGDDLAVNAEGLVGLHPSRELPILGKVALGSVANSSSSCRWRWRCPRPRSPRS